MNQWYYEKDNQPQGPISEAEIVQKLVSNEIARDTLVWVEGMETWTAANKSRLASKLSPPPPTAPPPTAPPPSGPATVSKPAFMAEPEGPANELSNALAPPPPSSQGVGENPYQAPGVSDEPNFKEEDLHTTELIYASRSIRLVAFILDSIILSVIFLALLFVTGGLEIVTVESGYADSPFLTESDDEWLYEEETTYAVLEDTSIGARLMHGIYWIIIYFVVNGYLLAKRGQTVGKLICNIQIVNYNTGKVPDMIALGFTRFFCVQIASSVFYPFGLINILFIFSDERRCLHDRMANTKVVLKGKSTRDYPVEYQ